MPQKWAGLLDIPVDQFPQTDSDAGRSKTMQSSVFDQCGQYGLGVYGYGDYGKCTTTTTPSKTFTDTGAIASTDNLIISKSDGQTFFTSERNSYYSSGNVGWSARSLFAYHGVFQQLTGASNQNLGDVSANTMIAQSYVPANTFRLGSFVPGIRKTGTPTDNLICDVYSSSGDLPATLIATSEWQPTGSYFTSGAGNTIHVLFTFSTGPTLTAGTKYWFVIRRSGALNASNYYFVNMSTASSYASGGLSLFDGSTWSAESSTNDLGFLVNSFTPVALYAVVQDASFQHIFRSSDNGLTWNEQDVANTPSVFNSSYPYDADQSCGSFHLAVSRHTDVHTIRVKTFNLETNTWTSGDLASADAITDASNERPHRVSFTGLKANDDHPPVALFCTSFSDDADIYFRARSSGSAWSALTYLLDSSHADAGLLADSIQALLRVQPFYYDIGAGDFSHRTISGTTRGNKVVIDASAANVETNFAVLSATPWQDTSGASADKAVIAFVDADGTLQEVIASLDTNPATFDSQNQVTSDTGVAGRQISTCRFNGVNYIAVCDGSNLDYHESSVAGTWTNHLNWKTGLTNATLSKIVPVPDSGVLITYTANNITFIEWLVPPLTSTPVNATDTGAIASSDAVSISATFTASDTGAITSTEAISVATTKSDSSTITGTDAISIAITSTGADTGAMASSDAVSIAASFTKADTGAIASTDASSVATALALADTGTIVSSDVGIVSLPVTATDSGAIASSDVASIAATVSLPDTGVISSSDATAINRPITLTDTGAIASTDAVSIAVTMALADTGAIGSSDATTISQPTTVADTGVIGSTDVASIAASFTKTDTGAIGSADAVSIADSFAASDTGAIGSSDLVTIAAQVTATDTGTIGSSDAVTTQRQIAVPDTGAIGSSDAVSIQVTFIVADTSTITGTDATQINAQVILPDTGAIGSTDATIIGQPFTLADTGAIGSTDSVSLDAQVVLPDTGAISSSDATSIDTSGGSVSKSAADTGAIVSNDVVIIAANVAIVDTTVVVNNDYASIAATFTVADTGVIGSSDAVVIDQTQFAVTIADTGAIGSSDAVSIAATLQVSDSGGIGSVDAVNVLIPIALTDSGAIASADSMSIAASLNLPDSSTINSTDSIQVGSAIVLPDLSTIFSNDLSEILADLQIPDSSFIVGDDWSEIIPVGVEEPILTGQPDFGIIHSGDITITLIATGDMNDWIYESGDEDESVIKTGKLVGSFH